MSLNILLSGAVKKDTDMRLSVAWLLLGIVMTLGSGCSTSKGTFRAYSGPDLRPDELATICGEPEPPLLSPRSIFSSLINRNSYTEIRSIDGAPVKQDSKPDLAIYQIVPGEHTVTFISRVMGTGAIGGALSVLTTVQHELTFTALAGHNYRVNYT